MYGGDFKFRAVPFQQITLSVCTQEQGRSNHVERVFSLFEVLLFCLEKDVRRMGRKKEREAEFV